MALPSVYSVALPIEVVASGGLLVRQVDTGGIALDDATYSYSVAMPCIEVDSSGVVDGTRVYSTHLRVTISPNGFPIIKVDVNGNATSTPFGGGGGGGGAGDGQFDFSAASQSGLLIIFTEDI